MVKVKHHLFAVLRLYVNCIIRGIEPFLIDFFYICKRNIEIIKTLVFECFCTHVIEIFTFMRRVKDNEALFMNTNTALYDSDNIDKNTFTLELFYLNLLALFLRTLYDLLLFAEKL